MFQGTASDNWIISL